VAVSPTRASWLMARKRLRWCTPRSRWEPRTEHEARFLGTHGQFVPAKTTVAETIRLGHRDGLIVGLPPSHFCECPNIFTHASKLRLLVGDTRQWASWAMVSSFHLKTAKLHIGSMDALQREKMRLLPSGQILTDGVTFGSGARCLGFQVPRVQYCSKSIAASL
jgi:hypothetical protein